MSKEKKREGGLKEAGIAGEGKRIKRIFKQQHTHPMSIRMRESVVQKKAPPTSGLRKI